MIKEQLSILTSMVLVLAFAHTAIGATSVADKKSPAPTIDTGKDEDAPGKAKEATPGKALVHTIKLSEYLKMVKPDQVVEKMDSQGKNNPDIFIVYKKNDDGTKQLVMQLFDLNRDGKVDLVKHFEKGKLVKTEADLDFDGMVDVVSEYDPLNGELKKKIQADGASNIWKYYFHNELRKKEVDRNSDGKPDMWVYYRNGKVIRTEIDQNFDGKITRIEGPLNPNHDKHTASSSKVGASAAPGPAATPAQK